MKMFQTMIESEELANMHPMHNELEAKVKEILSSSKSDEDKYREIHALHDNYIDKAMGLSDNHITAIGNSNVLVAKALKELARNMGIDYQHHKYDPDAWKSAKSGQSMSRGETIAANHAHVNQELEKRGLPTQYSHQRTRG